MNNFFGYLQSHPWLRRLTFAALFVLAALPTILLFTFLLVFL